MRDQTICVDLSMYRYRNSLINSLSTWSIYSFIFTNHFILVLVDLEPSPGTVCVMQKYTLDFSLVC